MRCGGNTLRYRVIMPSSRISRAAMRSEMLRCDGVMLRRMEGTNIIAGIVPIPKASIICTELNASPAASAMDRAA